LNSDANKRGTISFVTDVLKEGWLSKQSSGLVRKWNQRWFVLKSNNSLYYYKAPGASDVLGIIPLNDVRITVDLSSKRYVINMESTHANDGDGVHAAKLKSGVAVRNTKMKYTLSGKSKEECNSWSQLLQSCVGQVVSVDSLSELMSNQREAKERKKAKKRPVAGGGPTTAAAASSAAAASPGKAEGKRTGLFGSTGKRDAVAPATLRTRPIYGVALDVLAERDGQPVPILVQRAVDYLMETALDEEGLLRLSGSRAEMDALRAAFESGQPIDFRTPPRDAHTVAGMLKAFFRELPEPLLSPELNRRAADVVAQELPEITTALELRQIIVSMSDTAYETTKLLVRFLIAVAEHSFKNRMHKDNVLTVMIPTLQCVPAVFSIAMDCFELFFDDESTGRVAGGTNGVNEPPSTSPRIATFTPRNRALSDVAPPHELGSRARSSTNEAAGGPPSGAAATSATSIKRASESLDVDHDADDGSTTKAKSRTLPRRLDDSVPGSSPPRSPAIARPQTKAPQPPAGARSPALAHERPTESRTSARSSSAKRHPTTDAAAAAAAGAPVDEQPAAKERPRKASRGANDAEVPEGKKSLKNSRNK
jgi:hypothetical protein